MAFNFNKRKKCRGLDRLTSKTKDYRKRRKNNEVSHLLPYVYSYIVLSQIATISVSDSNLHNTLLQVYINFFYEKDDYKT